jgi:negative regulator of flagellin synthesis FlgM
MSINKLNSGGQKLPLDNQKLSQQQQAQSKATAQTDAQKATSSNIRQDSVSLTQSAQQLTEVQKKSAEAPVNQEKVDRLKKAIQKGEYSINPESLARKISNLEAEIFGGKA